ncbi:hypothetical protein C7B65_13460 [Phormidesmis priestleyi ULC007]|uniref:Uncharacterized protein n=1 Tax=Phormidesmis priestleyi ULC007 TaxID=1920490 RepID=A0A2T1DEX7_9CYAN|nr:hypothetical protein [Phormidesmis priestleyi]PSB19017.1 hypothetical protein C7B65_13460 [Phormidesmis priestleyi ULC007]PZO54005.1 MAG: hypothetical protein DCF14_03515 [Phormidesmis priestleyi]
MNSFSHDRLIKRMIALLGATGLAAFSGLPAFAQVNPNNRSVDCSAYVNGGIGGPMNNSGQSSYDTATVPQNRSNAMNQSDNSSNSYNSYGMSRDGQFSARNPNAAIPFRSNGPAGTSGGESNLNLQAYSADRGASFNRAYSTPDRSSANPIPRSSANPIPVECLPGGVNNR